MKPDKLLQTVGRFAPSPTGPLHFGSLVAAVGSYCLARRDGGKWLVRIEDLDRPREVAGAADLILSTLERLGFEWDEPPVYQSRRIARYKEVLKRLQAGGHVFPCACSRREILASAPHPGEEGPVYAGTCRQGLPPGRSPRSLRLRVPGDSLLFVDGVFGEVEQCLASAVGDFVLRRADGLFAYQLAVVVDDADSGVNQVVRGADLLHSTPRQIYLYACLGWPVPRYVHLPLALNAGGDKISKRQGEAATHHVGGDGRVLAQALRFLGQEVPAELTQAPPGEILRWGVEHFCLEAVPRENRIACIDEAAAVCI
ncbi:tRNA glutamyl-Q(34) synthetase GluQRS [Desulfuromonas sp. AOP6]|uniref:tRNA glutamyl-Q(34) synthetase GluQRS n=1 Tax=Desulfuromonas sp. AOP6 TaxID=1566351 RepID=UPI001CED5379|nr:tRNA glutamyl-Q(34) synthetase GluQRS [Desulfuromonas sp. AOP6]